MKLIGRLTFLLPFAMNQIGSLFYYFLLGSTSLSIGPTLTNAVNLLVTFCTEKLLKKDKSFSISKFLKFIKLEQLAGISFIVIGVALTLM